MRNQTLTVCLTRIKTVVQKSDHDLQAQTSWDADLLGSSLIPNILQRIKNIEPDISEVCGILSSSSRPITQMTDVKLTDLINSLTENLKDVLISYKNDLIVALKDEITALEEKPRFLRNFLRFKSKMCIGHEKLANLLTYSEGVVDNVACFLFSCMINNSKDEGILLCRKKLACVRNLFSVNH